MNLVDAITQSTADAIQNAPPLPEVRERQRFDGAPPTDLAPHTQFVDCDFRNLSWSGTMSDLRFLHCRFENVHWENASWTDMHWERCDLIRTRWSASHLSTSLLMGCRVDTLSWEKGSIDLVTSTESEWSNLSGHQVDMVRCVFTGSHLKQWQLDQSRWRDSSWVDCDAFQIQIHNTAIEKVVIAQTHCVGWAIRHNTGHGLQWAKCDLDSLQMDGNRLQHLGWNQCHWTAGHLSDGIHEAASFSQSHLRDIQLSRTAFGCMQFADAVLEDVHWDRLQVKTLLLGKARLNHVDAHRCTADRLEAVGAEAGGAHWRHCSFGYAILFGQPPRHWQGANLKVARFHPQADTDDSAWRRSNPLGPRAQP